MIDNKENFRNLINKGLRAEEMSEIFVYSVSTIFNRICDYGLKKLYMNKSNGKSCKYNFTNDELLNKSTEELCMKYGCTRHTIYYRIGKIKVNGKNRR